MKHNIPSVFLTFSTATQTLHLYDKELAILLILTTEVLLEWRVRRCSVHMEVIMNQTANHDYFILTIRRMKDCAHVERYHYKWWRGRRQYATDSYMFWLRHHYLGNIDRFDNAILFTKKITIIHEQQRSDGMDSRVE
jgi:hypothetical protein